MAKTAIKSYSHFKNFDSAEHASLLRHSNRHKLHMVFLSFRRVALNSSNSQLQIAFTFYFSAEESLDGTYNPITPTLFP